MRTCRFAQLALATGVAWACSTTDPVENYQPVQLGNGTNGVSNPAGGLAGGSGGSTLDGSGESSAGAGGTAPTPHGGSAGEGNDAASASTGGAFMGGGGSSGGASSSGGTATGGTSAVSDCEPPPVANVNFTKQSLRAAAADCALHHFCVFEALAVDLENEVVRYDSSRGKQDRDAAREAWRAATASWQHLELFQFGPLASPAMAAGKDSFQGRGFRDKIYAWPTTARCRVDEQVIGRQFVDQGMQSALISGRGLFALEALLFYEGEESACPAAGATATAHASLDAETLADYRLDYALAVAEDVVDQIRAVQHAFSAEGDDFREKFISASGYPSEQEAMNVLGWALMYVEREVKDYKLGMPAGFTLTAPVSEPEAVYAGSASDNLRNNLLGFRSLFQGCGSDGEGLGFDDWLTEAGHEALALDIIEAWHGAFAAVDRLPPLSQAAREDVELAYAAVKALTDLLKSDLLGPGSPLNLDLPASVEGDTD